MTGSLFILTANQESWSYYSVTAIFYVIIAFALFYFITKLKPARRILRRSERDPALSFISEKITGFLLFGLVPFLLCVITPGLNSSKNILTPGKSEHYWYILLILFIIITFLTFNGSKRKTIQERSPRIRIKNWTIKYCIIATSGWIIYILGYEFLFRGILWLVCYRAFGLWVALVINIVLYVAVHLDQGLAMSLGAVPFGILLCLLTFLTGSFLFAFLIHGWLAISTEIFSVYNNPDLSFSFRKQSKNR
ncbi:MAG: CPBP family intramembrane glutamic endopeptidase [Bacteroidales bacterium]